MSTWLASSASRLVFRQFRYEPAVLQLVQQSRLRVLQCNEREADYAFALHWLIFDSVIRRSRLRR